MKNFKFLLLILFVYTSCQETPQAKFERDGISLTSPKGWNVSDEENIDNQGYYLSIEKDGLNSSGVITISWINNELDLNESINIYQNELRNNIISKNSNLTFENQKKNKFNEINTTSVNYTFSILGLKHEGILHFFYENDKSFVICKQEATEDNIKNKKGFESIEQSFKIEN